MKMLKYTHPSACEYSEHIQYSLDELLKEMKLERIKAMFEPIDFKWEDVDLKEDMKNVKSKKK